MSWAVSREQARTKHGPPCCMSGGALDAQAANPCAITTQVLWLIQNQVLLVVRSIWHAVLAWVGQGTFRVLGCLARSRDPPGAGHSTKSARWHFLHTARPALGLRWWLCAHTREACCYGGGTEQGLGLSAGVGLTGWPWTGGLGQGGGRDSNHRAPCPQGLEVHQTPCTQALAGGMHQKLEPGRKPQWGSAHVGRQAGG